MAILRIRMSPRQPATGVTTELRVTGGGARADYGGEQWEPALLTPPRFATRLGFDGQQFGQGAVMTVGEMTLANDGSLTPWLDLIWQDAAVVIESAPRIERNGVELTADGDFTLLWQGTARAIEASDAGAEIRVILSDATARLDVPVALTRYTGTGGVEGPARLKGKLKRRGFGACAKIRGELVDEGNLVYQFGEGPATFQACYDGGVAFVIQGDVASYAALVAATVDPGKVVTCAALAMAKPWDRPAYPFTADVTYAGAMTAAGIAQAIVTARTAVPFVAGTVAAFDALQPAAARLFIDDETTVTQALDALIPPLGAWWRVTGAGQIELGRWEAGAAVLTIDAADVLDVARGATVMPTWRRSLGFDRIGTVHSEGDIAKALLASEIEGTIDYAQVGGATAPDPNATRNIPQGIHSTGNAYARGDIVRTADGSASYIAKQVVPVGTLLTNTAYWDLFVQGSGGAAGAAGVSGILSNQAHVVVTATDGSGGNYASAGGQFSWYEGSTNRTGSATFAKVGTGSWYSINSAGVYTISDPGVDQATCQFDGTYNGVTIRLTYSIAKSKQGATGATGAGGPQGPAGPSAYTITTQGAVTASGATIDCAVDANAWGVNGAYSSQAFTGGAYLAFRTPNLYGSNERFMIGLNGDAAGSAGYDTIDHALYFFHESGSYFIQVYESGTLRAFSEVGGTFRAWSAAHAYKATYDNRYVLYWENDTLLHRTDVGPGRTFSVDFAAFAKASVAQLAFGPVGSTAKPSFTMVANGSAANLIAIGGNSVRITAHPGAWDIAAVYSQEAYRGGAMMAVTIPPPVSNVYHEFMWALNSDAAASATHGSLDYAFYARAYETGGSWQYKIEVRSPGNVAPLRTLDWTAAHRLSIVYDGQRVTWLIDNTPVYQDFVGSGLTLALDSAFASAGQHNDILFAAVAVAQGQGFTLIGRGGCVVTANSIERVYGDGNWTADAYSLETWRGGAFVSFRPKTVPSGDYMVGLNSDPTSDQSYTSLDFAWYIAGTESLMIYENGAVVPDAVFAAATPTDLLQIKDDDTTVTYLRNGVVLRTRPSNKTLLFLDSSFATVGAKVVDLAYGPVGSAGAAGLTVPGLAPVTVSCDFAGNPKSGQLPKSAQVRVLSGASDVTEATTYSIAASGCTATVSNSAGTRGLITVTAMTADSATATVTATYSGASVQVLLNLSKSRDGAAGGSVSDPAVSPPIAGTYDTDNPQGGILNISVGPGGTLRAAFASGFDVNAGSTSVNGKFFYRENGTTTWLSLGTEQGPFAGNSVESGFIGMDQSIAGPGSLKLYQVILCLKRTGSATVSLVNANDFTVQWS